MHVHVHVNVNAQLASMYMYKCEKATGALLVGPCVGLGRVHALPRPSLAMPLFPSRLMAILNVCMYICQELFIEQFKCFDPESSSVFTCIAIIYITEHHRQEHG